MKLQENIRTLFAKTMGYDTEDIEAAVPLLEIGADSFTMMSVTRKIKEIYKVTISMRDIFENINTIEKITSHVIENAKELPSEETEQLVFSETIPQTKASVSEINNIKPVNQVSQSFSLKNKQKEISNFSESSKSETKVANNDFKPFTPKKMSFSQSSFVQNNSKNDDASTAWVDTQKTKELTPEQVLYLDEFIKEYCDKTIGSKTIAQDSRAYLCNNRKSSSGFRIETKELLYPIVTNASKGSKIWDVDNNEYVDVAMGFGSTLFGHNPDFLKKCLAEQIEKGYQIGPESDLTAENARLIAETINMDRVLFSNTGTEAVMTAIRIARAASGKNKIVIFQNSYHGHCDNVLVVPDIESDRFEAKGMVPGIPESAIEDTLVLPYGNVQALSFIEENAEDIAAVIVEPVRNYLGNKNPKEFLKNIREITRRKDIVLVFDEVLVGFRLALGGAQEWFDIESDITTYGKAIAAGIPVGIVAGKSWCMDWVDGGYWSYGDSSAPIGNQTYTAGTFCKHPLAMTAVNAVIKEMLKKGSKLQYELNEKTEEMCAIMDDVIAHYKVPLKVHRFGSNFRFSMSGNLSFAFQPLELDIFFYHVINEGVYVWEGRTCFISTAHTDEDLNKIINAVHNAIQKMKAAGFWIEKKKDKSKLKQRGLINPVASFFKKQTIKQTVSEANVVVNNRQEIKKQKKQSFQNRFGVSVLLTGEDLYHPDVGAFFTFLNKRTTNLASLHCYFNGKIHENKLQNWVTASHQKLIELPLDIHLKTNGESTINATTGSRNDSFRKEVYFAKIESLVSKTPYLKDIFPFVEVALKNNIAAYELAGSLGVNAVVQYTKEISTVIAKNIATYKNALESTATNKKVKQITLQVLCFTGETETSSKNNAYRFLYDRAKENNSYWLQFITQNKNIGDILQTLSSDEKEYVLKNYIDKCIQESVLTGTKEYCKKELESLFSLGFDKISFITSLHDKELQHLKNSCSLLEDNLEETVDSELNTRRDSLCPIVSPQFMEEAKTETKRIVIEDNNTVVLKEEKFTLPLTGDQKALLVLSKVSEGAMMTNSQTWALKVEGKLDVDKLQKSYQKVTDRHIGMRITIEEETLQQTFHQQFEVSIEVVQIKDEEQPEEFIKAFLKKEASKQYDLSTSLHRLTVLKINENYSVIVLSCNHITIDGVGVSVLYTELAAYYNDLNAELEETMGFDKFVKWRLKQSDEKHFKLQEKYWLDEVSTEISVLDLPLDNPRPLSNQYNGSSYLMNFQKDFFKELKAFSVENNCTYFMVVFAAFQVLLYRLSSQRKSVIGVAFNGRTIPNSDLMIGFCANIYPILCEIKPEENILDFLSRVKYKLFNAYENQDYPFSELIQKGLKNRDVSRFPFFSVAFNWDRLTLPKMDRANVSWEVFKQEHVKLDLVPNLMEVNGELSMTLEYNTDLFNTTTIEKFCKYYEDILYTIIKNPKASISSLGNCIESDVAKVISWQGKKVNIFENINAFHELFEHHTKLTPNKIALIQGNNKLTYEEVNEKANRLSRKFYSEGYQKEDLVGICLNRSFNQIISILAVMKAGLAYVPINPEFPESRISQLIDDAGVRSIITVSEHALKLPVDDSQKIILDNSELQTTLEQNSKSNLELDINREDLLYIMYTSGTTGKPKGVKIAHKGILNLAHNFSEFFKKKQIDIDQNWGWNSTFTFDGSLNALTQFFQGRTLVLLEDVKEKSPEEFWNYLNNLDVKVVDASPSQLQFLLSGLSSGNITSAPHLVIGGEATGQSLLKEIKNYCNQYNVTAFNVYGPTECSVVSHISVMTDHEKPVVGNTLDNVEAYVVNDLLQQVPIGAKGELILAGIGVSEGYHNNEELTQQKFIELPELTDGRLYRTGDIVRWLPDGILEYIGRSDNQVQIRGVRIELGEVKALINKMDEVNECVVVVKKDTDNVNSLAVYLVLNKNINVTESELFQKMKLYLPANMLPSSVIYIDEIPTTLNGKVDYKKLPDTKAAIKNDYVPPVKDIEKVLCMIWQDVFELEKIGIYDDFFFIGGHSLTAMKIIAKIQTILGRKVNLTEMFKYSNIAFLAQFLEVGDKQESKFAIPVVYSKNTKERVLSFQQESFWLVDKVITEKSIYNVTELFELSGGIDSHALNLALCNIVERHEILRTVIKTDKNNAPVSVLLDKPTDLLEIVVCTENIFSENILKEHQKEVFRTTFDFSIAYMLKARLIKVSDTRSFLLLAIPHIATDGWSMNIFMNELRAAYKSVDEGVKNTLKKLPIQYADYAVWQRKKFTDVYLEEQKKFWVNKLTDIPLLHSLPLDHLRPKIKSYQGTAFKHSIGKELSDKIQKFNKKYGITMFITLQSAFALLLRRWSNKTDVIMGTPVANRSLKEVQGLIGMFVNTLVLRNKVNDDFSLLSYIQQNKENIIEAFEYQDYPFNLLVEDLNPERELGHSPIFQIMFALENSKEESETFANNISIEKVKKSYYSSKFDLTLYMNQKDEDITIEWEYDTTLFESDTIHSIAESYISILESIVIDPDTPVKALDFFSKSLKENIISLSEGKEYVIDSARLDFSFEEQVLKNPDKVALEYLDSKMTYEELNLQANKIANYLIDQGLKKGDFVIVHTARSMATFSYILGVLKAGAVYSPVDSETPEGRVKHILQSSNAQFIICDKDLDTKLFREETIINITNEEVIVNIQNHPEDKTKVNGVPSDLAYSIYTSGSSGIPKGCLLSHSNVQNLLLSCRQMLNFTPNSRTLQFASISFDASVFEWVNALTLGGTLVIVPEEIRTIPEELSSFVKEKEITHALIPPILIPNLLPNDFKNVTSLVIGGEHWNLELIKDWKGVCKIYNAYGPSEVSVITSIGKVNMNEDELLNIGRPILNTQCFVLNKYLNLQPVGAIGELYIGGESVGRGYLNNEELTEKSFVVSPFNSKSKLYKTGDLVRWNHRGKLEFIGRIDNQVKIRGYRIETGEIKKNIEKCNGVKLAHILVEKNQFQINEIIAFIETNQEVKSSDIDEAISNFLPSYMLPSRYIFMEQLPMTINGKVDVKELLKTDMFALSDEGVILPESEIEKGIAKIWATLLGIKNEISTKENFFRLGGHSLTIARLHGELKKLFNIQIELKTLYVNATIEKQAKLVEISEKEIFKNIQPVIKAATNYELSSSQKRLWVLCRFSNVNKAYNISNTKLILGKLHTRNLEKSFINCINRHESLRTNFIEDVDGTLYQTIRKGDSIPFFIEYHNLINKEKDTIGIINDFANKMFDLSSDLLIRVQLIQIEEEQYILQYVIHHIITDGWSIDILENELKLFYNNTNQNSKLNLPSLEIQYKDYTSWQKNNLNSAEGIVSRDFWKAQFNDTFPVLDLPADFARPKIKSYHGCSKVFEIEKNLLAWLYPVLKEEEATFFMGLTALLNVFLYKYSGQTDIILGVPTAGRDHADLNNQIGFYVNTIALRTQFEEQNSFIDVLNIVKQNMLASYAHQMYPIDELLDHINIERDISRNALFDVMIAFQDLDEDKKETLSFDGTQVTSYTGEKRDYSILDLTFSFVKSTNGLQLEVEYDTDLFRSDTIERMTANFLYLLKSISNHTNLEVNKLEVVNEKERNILLNKFNKPLVSKKHDAIKDLFEATVNTFPNLVAVIHKNKKTTYKELNQKANRFANYLKKTYPMVSEDLLIIHLEKTERLLVAVLAAAKLGNAYVPADINAPKNRLNYILEDTKADVLINEKLYDAFVKDENQYSDKNVKSKIDEDTPFTIIYTSGTTGKPKGSIITNKNVASRIQAEVKILNKKGKINTVNTTNAAFDVCLLEFFLPLLNGGSILIPTKEQHNSHDSLAAVIKKYKVNVLQGTPSFIQLLFQEDSTAKMLKGLTHICIGGESLNNALVERIKRLVPSVKVNNHFGPTEATIDAVVNKDLKSFERNIIGKPIAQTQVFIVNSENVLVPLGVVGELCIGGDGVTQGYLNNKTLTGEKFIDFLLNNRKIYKTGDLTRWLPDGTIEFIGRKDSQIKIRGYRVELKEIEHVLMEHENITDAALVVKENELKNKEIIAFVVLDKKMKSQEIKRHLKNKLSFYMIPNHIVEVSNIPLTINGKKDYKRLNAMASENKSQFIVDELRAPNEIDKQILVLWKKLLKIETIAIDDNFFSLGGNSIMIIEMNNELKSTFNTNFDISIFYEYTSVLELSDYIARKIHVENIQITPNEERSEGEIEIFNF